MGTSTPVSLHTSVFHSLEDQIAVVDRSGNILDVNWAWQNFGSENALPSEYRCIDRNYLEVLSDSAARHDSLAAEALQGIADVLSGKRTVFYFEYPCHSPQEKRWFSMRVTSLQGEHVQNLFVISHHNITARKLAEERVEELAMQDPLTTLGNRRAFHLFFNREFKSSIRNGTPVGLVLLDVDHFKNYNDAFGHAAGDQCLKKIGQVLQNHARRHDDHAARIGGDEFALILGNAGTEMVQKTAESILSEVSDLKMFFDESEQVTASIGLISVIPQKHQNEESLFQEADRALYLAKSAGRNRVVCAPAPAQPVSDVTYVNTTATLTLTTSSADYG